MSWSLHCVTGRGRPYDVEEGTGDRPWRLAMGGCAKFSSWSSPESVVNNIHGTDGEGGLQRGRARRATNQAGWGLHMPSYKV